MYTNIGAKIKVLAKVLAWIGIIGSAIYGGFIIGTAESFYGILIGIAYIVIGGVASWISSWVLYGFGELIEKTTEIADNTAPYDDAEEEEDEE